MYLLLSFLIGASIPR